jgi:hypothetical protein
MQVGTTADPHGVSDRLACVLVEAHEPAQELLHVPEGAVNLVVPGQNRRGLRALIGSLGQEWTGCGQLFPESSILLGEPIDLSLECPLLVRHKSTLIRSPAD